MEDSRQAITIRIRELRRERALTQEELAEALGLSRQSINAMEAGRCLPSLPVALQIASYFSVPLTAIFAMPAEAFLAFETTDSLGNPPQNKEVNSIAPWSPLQEMREALDDLMDEQLHWSSSSINNLPAVNIGVNDLYFEISLRLPGYSQEDLHIEVGDDFLQVSAEPVDPPHSVHYLRQEFAIQPFSRTIALPSLVQSEKAEAEMKYGILKVRLPKQVAEKPKTTRISIRNAE